MKKMILSILSVGLISLGIVNADEVGEEVDLSALLLLQNLVQKKQ
jgi:hypothetical protein